MAKQKYEVVAGTHYDQNQQLIRHGDKIADPDRFNVYQKGDIVESEEDLEKKFVNKFKKVVEYGPRTVSAERKGMVEGMISSGSWAEADRDFLEQLSDDGFNRLSKREASVPVTQPAKEKKSTSSLGEDVTDEFQVCYDEGYKVWRNASGKHQITKGGSKKVLNPAPLEQDDVENFVIAYMKEK